MIAIRFLLISVLAALAGAIVGEIFSGGSVPPLGPAVFVSYFTLLGSLGLLAPGYAIMKAAHVRLFRRYLGVISLGALSGALLLLPLDLATGRFDAAPLGSWFGAVTGVFWVLFHSASRALTRRDSAT